MSPRRRLLLAAIVGVVAAIATLAAAEVVALMVAPASSPLVAVGSFVIDIVPPWVKDAAIALFGTGDKAALLVGLGLLVLVLASLVGILELRRPPFGVVGLAVIGLIATSAAVTRAEATPLWALPAVIGAAVGVLVLRLGLRRLRQWVNVVKPQGVEAAISRRGFIGFSGATTAAALIAGMAARTVNATTAAVNAVRSAVVAKATRTWRLSRMAV